MDWYPHDIKDFDADTIHLSPFEDGCYCRLLRWYYQNERPLPDDDQALASICRIGLSEWQAIAPKLRAFFVTRDTKVTTASGLASVLHHKRCDVVILQQNKRRKDWRKRQNNLRKHGILDDVTRDTSVSHAPIGEERKGNIDSESIESLGRSASPKGSRLPAGWQPSEDALAWARQAGLIDLHPTETEKFRDYWWARAGAGARKVDWDATWRVWMRKAGEDRGRKGGRNLGRLGMAGVATDAELKRDREANEARNRAIMEKMGGNDGLF